MRKSLLLGLKVLWMSIALGGAGTQMTHAQQNDLDQIVSVNYQNQTIKSILEDLRITYNLNIAYGDDAIRAERKTTLILKDKTLQKVLDELCTKNALQYKLIADRIVLSPVKENPTNGPPRKITINGYVSDAATGEKLIGANVANLGTYKGVSTNTYGFYSLTIQSGDTELAYSFVGYQRRLLKGVLNNDTTINIALKLNVDLPEIIIEDEETEENVTEPLMGTIDVSVRELDHKPTLTGEVDVLRSLQSYPGVNFGNEGTVSFYVRGGSPDQNLILLDGVPIYNTYHMFGLVPIFNGSAINNARLIKGGFPARYSGRLSSVFDVHMREGNMKKFHGEASVGFLTAKASIEGPIKPDTTSFFFAFRRTYADLFAEPITREVNRRRGVDGSWSFFFYDLNAKVNHRFSNKDRLYFSVYNSRDKGRDSNTEELFLNNVRTRNTSTNNVNWGNFTASLRWNHVYGKKLFSNATLLYSDYNFLIRETAFIQGLDSVGSPIDTFNNTTLYNSDIRDIGGQLDFHYYPNANQELRFGVSAVAHAYRPGVFGFSDTIDQSTLDTILINALEYNAYIEDEIRIGKRFKANLGVHGSYFDVEDTFYTSFEPRASMRYLLSDHVALKASYARMTQYIHLLNNAQVGFPVDLWVPTTNRIEPQRAFQYSIGLNTNLPKQYQFNVEAYYRRMDSIIEYENGASFLTPQDNWQDKVTSGFGEAFGAEFFLRKGAGKTKGWISYTISQSRRTFKEINNGQSFPFRYDHTHDVSITAIHQFKENIFFSAAWHYHTGSPYTQAVGVFNLPGGGQGIEYSSRNAARLIDYHRLDLSVSFTKKKTWGERIINLNVYNAYNRKNPFFVYLRPEGESFTPVQVTYFPLIPSASYTLRF